MAKKKEIKNERFAAATMAAKFLVKCFDADIAALTVLAAAYNGVALEDDEDGYKALTDALEDTKNFIDDLLKQLKH